MLPIAKAPLTLNLCIGLVSPIPTLPNPSAILIVAPEAAPTSALSNG